eukprot:5973024-Amphidinium_carterae.2
MELKVAYKQRNKTVIENKLEYKQNHFHDYSIITTAKNLNDEYAVKMTIEIYLQAQSNRDELHPAHQNRFFLFLVQHYLPRLHNIFQRAGATVDEYNQVLAYFDKKCAVHFTRPNRLDLQMMRSAPQQTIEGVQQDLQSISQLREIQTGRKTQSIPEEENEDNYDERSTTRTSGTSRVKRKIMDDLTDVKKQHPGATIINIYNATIHTQTLGASSVSASPRTMPQKEGDSTVHSTPRAI